MVERILSSRLAACVHVSRSGESFYWWKGKQESMREVTMMMKTSGKALPSLIRTLKKIHPYDTPEILAVRVEKGDPAYLKWMEKELRIEN